MDLYIHSPLRLHGVVLNWLTQNFVLPYLAPGVGLERGPLSLVSTIEELLEGKRTGSGLEIREYGRRDRHVDQVAHSIR
jgi:hypothetical protein